MKYVLPTSFVGLSMYIKRIVEKLLSPANVIDAAHTAHGSRDHIQARSDGEVCGIAPQLASLLFIPSAIIIMHQ